MVPLNPLVQQVTEVGVARVGATWNPFEAVHPFLERIFGGCPTLLLPSAMLPPRQAVDLYAYVLEIFDNGSRVLESVRAYPGDPWNRIQHEMEQLGAGIEPEERDGERALTAAKARE